MTGVKSLLGSFHNFRYRNLADYNFYFHLREQGGIHFNTTIHLAGTLLNTTTHNLRHGHTGYTKVVQSFLQVLKLRQFCNNNNLINTVCHSHVGSLGNLNGCILLEL